MMMMMLMMMMMMTMTMQVKEFKRDRNWEFFLHNE